MEKIAIIGAGGFGREVKFLIDRINLKHPTYEIIGFYDDNTNLPDVIHGIPFLGSIEDLIAREEPISLALGIGIPAVKRKIVSRLNSCNHFKYPALLDPSVVVSNDNVTIGDGSVVCAGVIITCNIKIENFVTLNLSCTVGHDTIIRSFASFMPSVNISGEVLIEEAVYIGTGAKIINQLEIGSDTVVGAGAVVSKSLPEKCTAVGIPAKPIKFHA